MLDLLQCDVKWHFIPCSVACDTAMVSQPVIVAAGTQMELGSRQAL